MVQWAWTAHQGCPVVQVYLEGEEVLGIQELEVQRELVVRLVREVLWEGQE